MSLISERLKGRLDGVMDNVKREKEEVRKKATEDTTAMLKPVLESRDAEIARLQSELESKSSAPDGESAIDFADRVGDEIVDYLNAGLGYM
jgi:hypothetical protein